MSSIEEGSPIINEWKEKSKIELKIKIKSNLTKRATKLSEIVNTTTKHLLPNVTLPYCQDTLISISLNHIYINVDKWKGVNISAMNKIPKTFTEYYKRADNWWNRYKAEWIGNHYFFPFLQKELYQYISTITNNNITIELLYFMILSNIINAEIHYHRAKAQPLILDQAFIKSKDLDHLFHNIGIKHCIPWQIPINNSDSGGNYRMVVRNYVKQWAYILLQHKQSTYDTMNTNNCNQSSISIPPPISLPTPDDTFSQYSDNSSNSMYTIAPLRKRFYKHQKPLQTPSIPIRSHPYKIPNMYNNYNAPCTMPTLSAQCEIKVYYDTVSPVSPVSPYIHNNRNRNISTYAYTGRHSPSFNYIYDNEDIQHTHSYYNTINDNTFFTC